MIRAAASTEARVLVLDSVVPPGNEPHGAKWLDVLMLTLLRRTRARRGAMARTLGAAGLEPVQIGTDLIEARRR